MQATRKSLPLFCVALSLLAGCSAGTSAVVAPQPAARETLPFPIVQLRGDGAALGTAHGVRFNSEIHTLFDGYLKTWFSNPALKLAAQSVAVLFEAQLQDSHRREIRALAEATHLDEHDIMLANCFLDLSPMTACSTVALPAGASPDGVARFGRNLDFPSFNIADKYSVLMIYHPQGKNAFAAVSWPGLIGVLSGMNEHGLSLANMEVTRDRRMPQAMPYTLLYRTLLEDCRTVQEAITLLEKSPRQTANNLMLMDASGDRAVVEITPGAITVRRAPDRVALISTNHHRGTDLNTPGRCDRYDLLHDTTQRDYGKIDEAAVEAMLNKVGGSMTLQSMIFEPANRAVLLSVGSNAATRKFYRVELKKLFTEPSNY
jgi:isopenicillin-N N-acyltransferase-like protein